MQYTAVHITIFYSSPISTRVIIWCKNEYFFSEKIIIINQDHYYRQVWRLKTCPAHKVIQTGERTPANVVAISSSCAPSSERRWKLVSRPRGVPGAISSRLTLSTVSINATHQKEENAIFWSESIHSQHSSGCRSSGKCVRCNLGFCREPSDRHGRSR